MAVSAPFVWTAQHAGKKSPAKNTAAKKAPAKSGAKSSAKAPAKSGAKSPAKSSAKSPASKSGTARSGSKSSAAKGKAGTSRKYAGKKASPRRPARVVQQQPTQERYKDIEAALAQRGYLKAEPTGEWGSGSQDALKRFQQDQNLSPTGKIDSLSLIALGLGPNRNPAREKNSSLSKGQQ